MRLEDDQMCYVCGKDNPEGFRLKFSHPRKGRLTSELTFRKEHQGYKNIVHGGMIATVLDEIMANLAWLEGKPAVTVELAVRLKKAVPVGRKVLLEGILEKEKGRVLYLKASAKGRKGELYATARAKCLRMPPPPAGGPASINLASRLKEG